MNSRTNKDINNGTAIPTTTARTLKITDTLNTKSPLRA